MTRPRVVAFATQGPGSGDERRLRSLLAPLEPTIVSFDRARRAGSAMRLLRAIRRLDPQLVVMEGTGLGGGIAVLASGRPYVVSSGDAIGPYLGLRSRPLGWAGALYERVLCARAAGFIGWSPYLVGRALTFGVPRAMTAANWAFAEPVPGDRERIRAALGIPADAIVFGIVGSVQWNRRRGYCYGLELVRAARLAQRSDLRVLIVGDGDGLARLAHEAGDALGTSVLLPGRVAREEVAAHLAAMDVGSLPQSVDGVGSFRYTTKISEYLAARVPVVTGQIPLAYDLDEGWLWRLPGDAPWDEMYVSALAQLMTSLQRPQLERRRPPAQRVASFDAERQQRQVCAFLEDVIARHAAAR